MFEYLTGTITMVFPEFIVVDVAGVGYRVQVTNPYAFTEGQSAQVFVQQIIRDTEHALYGFSTQEAKRTFNLLLTVTGIGPKSALAILANADVAGLAQAVSAGDITYLTKFPGIGKKTAQQIVLDLKGKLDAQAPMAIELAVTSQLPALQDAMAALVALGYSQKDVDKVEKKLAAGADQSTDDYLRAGLTLLTGK